MGTALTGLEIKDTYDGLVKTTDNGPLSGSLKVLTDGLGNDSTLSLSTTAASIAGTLAVSGNATFDTNTLFVDAAANQVGIGTASPAAPLNVNGSSGADFLLSRTSGATSGVLGTIRFGNQNVDSNMSAISAEQDGANNAANLIFSTQATGGATTERLRITSAGNVGIGITPSAWGANDKAVELGGTNSSTYTGLNVTSLAKNCYYDGTNWVYKQSAVTSLLYQQSFTGNHLFYTAPTGTSGAAITFTEAVRIDSNGIKFNGDTAAANALDDYEEGTWTMGISFGGASVGVTTSANTGTYTKIGRQVTVNGYFLLTNKGSSTGIAYLTGLPFTIGNTAGNFGAASLWFNNITFANQFQGRVNQNVTYIELEEITILGVTSNLSDADFANNSGIMISATYQV